MATKYNPFGKGGWTYGQRFKQSTYIWDYSHYLGPCPLCGRACFEYGGGWRCLAKYCRNNTDNPAPSVGPRPDWWNTNILIKMDGNMWCAHYDDFENLMESKAAFGKTPDEAIKLLKAA